MASPQPLPEDPDDIWYISDWLETMSDAKTGGAASFAVNAMSDTIQIEIQANKIRSALSQILGYSYADDGPPYYLYRPSCGIQHPYFPWLWSESATVSFQQPCGNPDDPVLDPFFAPTGYYYPRVPALFSGGYGPEYYGRYLKAVIDVKFAPMRYRILTDDDPTWEVLGRKEYRRNFANDGTEPSLEFISAEGASDESSFKFAERATSDTVPKLGNDVPPGSASFNGSILRRKSQNRFKTLWKQVPLNYICGEYGFNSSNYHRFLMPNPERLTRSLGTVNSAPFPGADGYPAGTLLFDSLRLLTYQLPVQADKEIGLWACDVGMDFQFFDPKRPINANWTRNPSTTAEADRKRGHHLVPYRESKEGYWYFVSCGKGVAGSYQGGSQLEETDFNDLFEHVDDTGFPIPP